MDIDMNLHEQIESLSADIRGIRDYLILERKAIDAAGSAERRGTGPPPPGSPTRRATDDGKGVRKDG
jgi:hypothetical protein